MKKYCVECGSENFSRSKKFCCEKCRQKYYYKHNKARLLEKHNEYYQENRETMINNAISWQNDNREKYREIARLSYYKRKEKKENG